MATKEKLDQLIAALQAQQLEAFDALYDETKEYLYYQIIAIVRDKSLSEDILQDAYLKILHHIDSYKLGTNPLAWMIRIARNLAINAYNKRKKEVLVDIDEFEPILGHSENTSIEQNPLIHTMYQVLKPKEIELIVMHVINGLTHKEISEIKKKPLGTILWQYNQAIKKMREKVGDPDDK